MSNKFGIQLKVVDPKYGFTYAEVVFPELLQEFWVSSLGNLVWDSGTTYIFKYNDNIYLRNSMGNQIKEPTKKHYMHIVGESFDQNVYDMLRD